MSKEDFIYVYFTGSVVTHKPEELSKAIKAEADYLLSQKGIACREVDINVNICKERVGEYLWANQYNVSDEDAEALAKEHGFSLNEIDWDNRDFNCAARGYKRLEEK